MRHRLSLASALAALGIAVAAVVMAPAPPASAAVFTAGMTTVSGGSVSNDSGNNNGMSATQVVSGPTGGGLTEVALYVGKVNAAPLNHAQVAVYANSAQNLPGALMSKSAALALKQNSWNRFTMPAATIAPNAPHWLVFNVDGANTQYKISSNGRATWKIPTPYGTWPAEFGTPTSPANTQRYAITMTWDSAIAPPTTTTPPPTTTTTAPPTTTTAPPPPGCTGQAVAPGDNVQAKIDAAPAGTVFCFAAGVYNVGALAPKAGDVFDGSARAAILDGQNTRPNAVKSATANDVTIRGFIIRNYATPLQDGAVHSFGATGWTIENNQITHNAAAAVTTDTGARVLNNLLDWNGQQGYAAHGENLLYENNEIANNNHDLATDATWEAGGGKAWGTKNAVFRGNKVHDNGGHGLWDDTNNIYITYDGNTVANNWGAGIYHEVSYDATIINNTISSNGMPTAPGGGEKLGWLWDAGIQLRASRGLTAAAPILIANNTVTNNYNGIALLDSPTVGCPNSWEGAYGPCYIDNILVRDNTVSMTRGATGLVQDGRGDVVFSSNVVFTGNHYTVAASYPPGDDLYDWFAWMNASRSWPEWQGYGHDLTGSFSVN